MDRILSTRRAGLWALALGSFAWTSDGWADAFAAQGTPSLAEQEPDGAAPGGSARPLVRPAAVAAEARTNPEAPPSRAARVEYDRGLTIQSADGRFALSPGAWVQMLYALLHDESVSPSIAQGLEVRRARIVLSGHVFGRHNRYFIQLGLSPADIRRNSGDVPLSPIFDAYFDFTHLRDAEVRIGQYRVPYNRQRVVPFGSLALVDRSVANFEFNLDRDVGLELHSNDLLGLGYLRYHAGVFMGEGRDARAAGDSGLLYVVRLEGLPAGMFADYSETDLERTRGVSASIGAAYAFLDNGKGNRGVLGPPPSDGGTTDTHNFTADFLIKLRGLTLQMEGYYRHGTRDYGDAEIVDDTGMRVPAPRASPRNGAGWFAQGDVLLGALPLDVALRYGQVRGLGSRSSLPDTDELAGGIGWFISGRAYRLNSEYSRVFRASDIGSGTDLVRVSLRLGF